MPLKTGKSKKTRQANIKMLVHEGYKPKQAVAIAYAQQRKRKKK